MDTAEMYPVPTEAATQGRTDQYIGTWLKGRKREDVVLASKVGGRGEGMLSAMEHVGWDRGRLVGQCSVSQSTPFSVCGSGAH